MKYNKKTENLDAYMLLPTSHYKYRLDIGEWELPVHPSVQAAIGSFSDLCRYGAVDTVYRELLDALAAYTNSSADQILLTNGSDNALRLILELFVTPESKLLVPVPTYTHLESMLRVVPCACVDKPYMPYTLSIDEYASVLEGELDKGYDLCYLVNPSMPTGHLLTDAQLDGVLCKYSETLFVVDEAYLEFSSQASCANLLAAHANLVVVKTFSKFFSLASLRIGYLIGSPTTVSLLKPLYNYKDVSRVSVECALATMKHLDFYEVHKAYYLHTADRLRAEMTSLITPTTPVRDFILNHGVYLTLICADPSDAKNAFDRAGIAVRNKDSDIKGALRITLGAPESMDAVLRVLKTYCA